MGFSYCGVSRAEVLESEKKRLSEWLEKKYHGEMKYMENYFEQRLNPALLVPDAKSVITLLLNYYPQEHTQNSDYQISKYALGKDYHSVIRGKLNEMLNLLKAKYGNIEGRGFVDSAPVLERTWAVKSGLGWIGKNGNLITKKNGSFFFIATLIVTLPFQTDSAFQNDYCGTCTQCIDECPTEAILPNKVIDGSKCISYFTIEYKNEESVPSLFSEKLKGWAFGCDICQDVCPWNRFSIFTQELDFKPLPQILNFSNSDWEELTEEMFKKIFKDSPLKRAKYSNFKRNIFINKLLKKIN